MSRLELALNPSVHQSNLVSHETENEIDTERLYSILQEQDQILEARHERNSKQPNLRIDVDVDQVGTEEEKENTFCSRSKWLGTPEFYNEFRSTKNEYDNVILDTYTMSVGTKRKAETYAGEPKKLKIDTVDQIPEAIKINNRMPDDVSDSSSSHKTSPAIDAENWDDDSSDKLLPWQDVDYQNLAIQESFSSASGTILKLAQTCKEFIIVVSDIDSESENDEISDADEDF